MFCTYKQYIVDWNRPVICQTYDVACAKNTSFLGTERRLYEYSHHRMFTPGNLGNAKDVMPAEDSRMASGRGDATTEPTARR